MLPSSVHHEQQQPDSEACTQHPDLNFNSIKRKQGSCRKWPVRDWEQGLGSESMTQQKCQRARASTPFSQEKEALSSFHRHHLLFSQTLQDRELQLPA